MVSAKPTPSTILLEPVLRKKLGIRAWSLRLYLTPKTFLWHNDKGTKGAKLKRCLEVPARRFLSGTRDHAHQAQPVVHGHTPGHALEAYAWSMGTRLVLVRYLQAPTSMISHRPLGSRELLAWVDEVEMALDSEYSSIRLSPGVPKRVPVPLVLERDFRVLLLRFIDSRPGSGRNPAGPRWISRRRGMMHASR